MLVLGLFFFFFYQILYAPRSKLFSHFSDVYSVESKKNEKETYAVKVFKKKQPPETETSSAFGTIMNEILIMKKCKHKHIVNFSDVFLFGGEISIVTEYCEGGSLDDLLNYSRDLTELEIIFILKQICKGVQALHNLNMVHRDLKVYVIILRLKEPISQA